MGLFEELRNTTDFFTYKEQGEGTPWGLGSQQGERIKTAATDCAKATLFGDLVEVGCYTGGTTLELAKVAQAYGRRVLAMDPWADDEAIYEQFVERTQEYRDIIDVIRLPSQDERAIEQINARHLCFAFIDGLHTHDGLLSDILAVGHCAGIIAVDDVGYACEPEDLRPAFFEGAQTIRREVYWHPRCREGYLL